MITWRTLITYLGILVVAAALLVLGNRVASGDVELFQDEFTLTAEARVERIVEVLEVDSEWHPMTIVFFEARITSSEHRGELVIAEQNLDDFLGLGLTAVSEGDRVVLLSMAGMDEWFFVDFVRINYIIILGIVFMILLLIFGRVKGLNAILSLGFTCVAVFTVFIPSILSGGNIHLWAVGVCLYSIIVTILIINGLNKKSAAAITGCVGGVVTAALLTLLMSSLMGLTGLTTGESMDLLYLPLEVPIDLRALIFAGIIIGASGAVMDVAVSISSALWELREQAPELSFSSIFKSGINIGRDVMASMTNTLVLAYIGSSLTVILLLVVNVGSVTDLFNSELVIVEFLKAIVGSMGILLAMPLTALVCAALFPKKAPNTGTGSEDPQNHYDLGDDNETFYE
ncbi:MAG: YibE/F family protein [Oscillospiraceae bacterium]|nr:YibE/F family protein [Oscillospiraceae bacterium]